MNNLLIALTFIAFLLLFIIIGVYSASQKQDTTADYLLASRNVNPWLTALSAMASGQSGFLFIGEVGYAYTVGISCIWLAIGWALGDYLAWWLFFRKLREVSEETSSETVSAFLSQKQAGHRWISIVSALITIIFLGAYAAAQLVAGSKALNTVFGWDYSWGTILGAVIVVIYCFSGGIRASIWTDAVQAVIMIGSLLLLLTIAIIDTGGFGAMWTKLAAINPQLVSLNPASLPLGFIPFFIGWFVAGFGVVGQPHIVVRAMAIDSPQNMLKAINIKAIAGVIAAFASIIIGLAARGLLPNLATEGDPELALPFLALEFLPAVLVGMMLAGIFSATMSTADSQILSCSAALTQDLLPQYARSYRLVKIGTLTVTAIVLAIALVDNSSVFGLVTFAWSILAAALGPLLMVRAWEKPVTTPVAITMMIVGILAAFIWKQSPLSAGINEVLPGLAAGLLVYFLGQMLNKNSSQSI